MRRLIKSVLIAKMFLTLVLTVFAGEAVAQLDQGQRDEQAMIFLKRLLNIPDQKAATSEAHNRLLKERIATTLIQRFALERTGRTSGAVTPAEMKSALNEFNMRMSIYIIRLYGSSGENVIDTWNRFSQQNADNIGFKVLVRMYQQYP